MNENQATTDKLIHIKSNSYKYKNPSKVLPKTNPVTSSIVLDVNETIRKQSFILPSLQLTKNNLSEVEKTSLKEKKTLKETLLDLNDDKQKKFILKERKSTMEHKHRKAASIIRRESNKIEHSRNPLFKLNLRTSDSLVENINNRGNSNEKISSERKDNFLNLTSKHSRNKVNSNVGSSRSIFNTFSIKHGDEELRMQVEKLIIKDKDKEISKNSFKNSKRTRNNPLNKKFNSQIDFNKFLINNHKIGESTGLLENSNKISKMTTNFHIDFKEKKLKGLNLHLDDSLKNIKSSTNRSQEEENNKNNTNVQENVNKMIYLLENLPCNQYDNKHIENNILGTISFSNLNRIIKVRNVMKNDLKRKDILYPVNYEEIKQYHEEIKNNIFISNKNRLAPKKIIKTNFSKKTIAKFVSIDGKYFQ